MLNNATGFDRIYIACGYTDLRQRIGIPLCYIGNLQLPKIEFIAAENGIKLQSVVENLDLCDPVQIVSPCSSDHG